MNQSLFGNFAFSASGKLTAAALLALLAGCGGSSSSTTPAVATTLVASPAAFVAYGNTRNVVGITGGTGPFRVASSNAAVLPVSSPVSGASIIFTPSNVTANSVVTLTVTDSAAATSTVTVTVTPATISNALIKITPATGSLCAPANNAAVTAATLCGGELATASVTLKDATGAVLANRAVQFDALTIGATFAATSSATLFSRLATVNTDAQGVATVALRADVEATSEAAFIRATDTVSTHRIDTWLTILKQTSGLSDLNVVPTTGGVIGYYTAECPFARREMSVYGGSAPYAITLPVDNKLVLGTGGVVAAAGSAITLAKAGDSFTVENVDTASCAAVSTPLTITDAKGVTVTANYTIAPGSATRSTTATTDLALLPTTQTLTADPLSAYCTSSSVRFTASGGTAPYIASTSIPQVTATLSGGGTVTTSFVSEAKWKLLKGQNTSILLLDAAGKVAIATLSCS